MSEYRDLFGMLLGFVGIVSLTVCVYAMWTDIDAHRQTEKDKKVPSRDNTHFPSEDDRFK